MRCIFCQNDSSESKSVEHIVPESLGNKTIILPKGFVCDKCNNYFARKVEKDVLEMPYLTSVRHRNVILSKKRKSVPVEMIFPKTLNSSKVTMNVTDNGIFANIIDKDVFESIMKTGNGRMIAMYHPEPEYPNRKMARFIAKCAFEYLVYAVQDDLRKSFVENELFDSQLDFFRKFARFDIGEWSYSQRRVYSEGQLKKDIDSKEVYETLHEMCLFINGKEDLGCGNFSAELYFAIGIMGIEYVICISDPDISGYHIWLEENKKMSPLDRDSEHVIERSLPDINPCLIKM